MELLDIIQVENENTGLDFKAAIYRADKSEDLLKDIMAMANAPLDRDRFIIVGVKHKPDGSRLVLGVEDFVDDAGYYQLVHSNIEPDIHFEYFYLEVEDKKVGVFRIYNCDNQPYLMKKDTKTLHRGDGFIRKGTSQTRLMRSDLDKIFAKRQVAPDLAAKLEAVFEVDNQPSTYIKSEMDTGLPSANARRIIRRAIADKEMTEAQREAKKQEMLDKNLPARDMLNFLDSHPAFQQMNKIAAMASGRSLPYKDRDLVTLRKDLENVEETYREDDLYYLYEQRAHKINIRISNNGEQYIENCSVEIRIKKAFGLVVAPRIYRKPKDRPQYMSIAISGPDYEALDYPNITETKDNYLIKSHLGDLRHNLTTPAFKVPVRLTLPVDTAGQQVEITLTLFGKNLPKPYVKNLLVEVS